MKIMNKEKSISNFEKFKLTTLRSIRGGDGSVDGPSAPKRPPNKGII
jgi:hypothetical protein